MPFKSEAQRRYMHAKHPKMAKEWEEKTPKGKKLPEHKPMHKMPGGKMMAGKKHPKSKKR